MRYIDNTNQSYKAATRAELAQELYRTSWAKVHSFSAAEWYANAANRIQEQYGYDIDYSSPTVFVDELIKHNLIMEMQ
tara:strand:+ start:2022 stop:2255 length:234 start_codon:yes stop_codon:yes gene_type:complete